MSHSHHESPTVVTPFRDLLREAKRIGWHEGIKRQNKPGPWRWFDRSYLLLLLLGGVLAGYFTRNVGSLVERIKTDPTFLRIALAYLGYEAVMKAVEAVQDEKEEFDAAVKWLTYPIRVGVPVAAIGFLLGGNFAGCLYHGESAGRFVAVLGVCLLLLAGGLWRAAYVARRKRLAAESAGSLDTAPVPETAQ